MKRLRSAEQTHIYINRKSRGSQCKITDTYACWNVNGRKPEGLYTNCRIKMHNKKRKMITWRRAKTTQVSARHRFQPSSQVARGVDGER